MICPLCAASAPIEAAACPSCEVDLRDYAQLHYAADLAFNDALRRARRNQWAEAAALLAGACALRPGDVEALSLWAWAAGRRGDPGEAIRLLLDALEAGSTPELEERYAAAMAELEAGGGAGPAAAALVDLGGRLGAEVERLEAAVERLEADMGRS
ncbi:MAG: hypothetical protein LBO20_04050, partial [Bifidobacteriaceae bacterium]|jgi:predicted Zn-dependent protease|nr:hypothetical protein [Bifidobacteriaceae bacterium]